MLAINLPLKDTLKVFEGHSVKLFGGISHAIIARVERHLILQGYSYGLHEKKEKAQEINQKGYQQTKA